MLELSKMSIEAVKILYPAIRAKYEKAREVLEKDAASSSGFLDPVNANNEMYARADLETLHKYFNIHMSQNLGWALNELYIQIGINKYFQVYFYPGSKSYEEYGDYIGGVLASSVEEMAATIVQSSEADNTRIEGMVKFEADGQNSLSSEQKDKLKTEGFHCREIYSILKM